MRKIVGPQYGVNVPLKAADGRLISDKRELLQRWADHFRCLLDVERTADISYINLLPERPKLLQLDDEPTLSEVVCAIQQQCNNVAAEPTQTHSLLIRRLWVWTTSLENY